LVYAPGAEAPVVLPELLTPDKVVAVISQSSGAN